MPKDDGVGDLLRAGHPTKRVEFRDPLRGTSRVGQLAKVALHHRVRTDPGQTELTLIPTEANSTARNFVRAITAPFDAA